MPFAKCLFELILVKDSSTISRDNRGADRNLRLEPLKLKQLENKISSLKGWSDSSEIISKPDLVCSNPRLIEGSPCNSALDVALQESRSSAERSPVKTFFRFLFFGFHSVRLLALYRAYRAKVLHWTRSACIAVKHFCQALLNQSPGDRRTADSFDSINIVVRIEIE